LKAWESLKIEEQEKEKEKECREERKKRGAKI
jgi:hypothetical protein